MSEKDFLKKIARAPAAAPLADIDWPQITPILDDIIVLPLDPPTHSPGGIEYELKTVMAERQNTCVGKIIAIGSLVYTETTRDGVNMDAEAVKPRVGDWVYWTQRAGQAMSIRDPRSRDRRTSPRLVWLKDNDIRGVFASETEARKVWSWVV